MCDIYSLLNGWCAAVPNRQVCSMYSGTLYCLHCSVQHGCKFHWQPGLNALQLTDHHAARCPPAIPACSMRSWCINDIVAVHGLLSSVISANTHHDPDALISGCNGLSQFREDTGRPSVPVREFNLIACPLAWLRWKTQTPFQTWIWTQVRGSCQPIRPADTVAY